jgi:hypothetical protein
MTTLTKVKFTQPKHYPQEKFVDVTNMTHLWGFNYISKNEGLIVDPSKNHYCHYIYGKKGESQEFGYYDTMEIVKEREDESDVKIPLIQKIISKGLPVIAEFGHQDSSAMLWVKSETEIRTDDYGSDFTEEGGEPKTLNDVTVEGLAKLIKYGVRQNDPEWDESLSNAKEYIGDE